MMIVFAVNCGSAASSVGPIGVTIALRAHLTFGDFLRWAAPDCPGGEPGVVCPVPLVVRRRLPRIRSGGSCGATTPSRPGDSPAEPGAGRRLRPGARSADRVAGACLLAGIGQHGGAVRFALGHRARLRARPRCHAGRRSPVHGRHGVAAPRARRSPSFSNAGWIGGRWHSS